MNQQAQKDSSEEHERKEKYFVDIVCIPSVPFIVYTVI